jgi:hypothetical protein
VLLCSRVNPFECVFPNSSDAATFRKGNADIMKGKAGITNKGHCSGYR